MDYMIPAGTLNNILDIILKKHHAFEGNPDDLAKIAGQLKISILNDISSINPDDPERKSYTIPLELQEEVKTIIKESDIDKYRSIFGNN